MELEVDTQPMVKASKGNIWEYSNSVKTETRAGMKSKQIA